MCVCVCVHARVHACTIHVCMHMQVRAHRCVHMQVHIQAKGQSAVYRFIVIYH